jgi:rSAM/selenodomain-associated transferase 2
MAVFAWLCVLRKETLNERLEFVLSIIVPTLNGARGLQATVTSVIDSGLSVEIIVVDGGSTDGSGELAKTLGARVTTAPPGRGGQLSVGAAAAKGEWLMFLHADTILESNWAKSATDFMASSEASNKAGYFKFRLDDDGPWVRRLETIVAWRSRALGLPYGDQGLLMGQEFYHRLGGFYPLPLMEDVEFVRRIGRRNLVALEADAVTSADRYRRDGYPQRMARNGFCLALYFLGVPPGFIAKVYA